MKILLVRNKYIFTGGEDFVFKNELESLKKAGHQCFVYEKNNTDINSFFKKFITFFSSIYSFKSKNEFEILLDRKKPDIVHIHSFFPQISTSIFDVCNRKNIKCVFSIHNFRIFCANGFFYRNHNICTKCFKRNPFFSIFYRCYKNSIFGSLSYSLSSFFNHQRNIWVNKVDAYICLSSFQAQFLKNYGISSKKIYIKPNFSKLIPFRKKFVKKTKSLRICFLGRISPEKGLLETIKTIKSIKNVTLKIIGTGPDSYFNRCRHESKGCMNIEFKGFLNSSQISKELKNCDLMITPSLWYEGFPLVILEAFSHSLPVIAPKIGVFPELITNDNGCLYVHNDYIDLRKKIIALSKDHSLLKKLSYGAYNSYLSNYTPQLNFEKLISIYSSVLENDGK